MENFEEYNLYIGRFQPPHIGHMEIFNQSLNKGERVCIAIRNVQPDDNNPLTAKQVKILWDKIYHDNENVKTIIIPNIKAVKYGRNVGYRVEEIIVIDNIKSISATQIRKGILEKTKEWKKYVNSLIWTDLENLFK